MQSFSEIDTTSKRASKAAGFAWGVAEEIGKNIRNLEIFGMPGIKNLNLYLKKIKKTSTEKPKKIEKENTPKSKEFCPIFCGMAFLDNCKKIENLYPLEASEEQAKLYGKLYSEYQKLIK